MNRAVRAGEAALVERGFFYCARHVARGLLKMRALCRDENQIVVPADVMIWCETVKTGIADGLS
ncbi:hypothetical protein [Paraburkholderia youngii]|uniref:Uncharacterized protein n=1 Tax=Paraburkholderia youngii TaxID=2782701 RepID=A0ABX2NKI0_9BURK|nr:hypothetical protein [Paraburkholderia youngii]NVI04931.1 hypothetical protein [Paraburkholderia youngii]